MTMTVTETSTTVTTWIVNPADGVTEDEIKRGWSGWLFCARTVRFPEGSRVEEGEVWGQRRVAKYTKITTTVTEIA